MELMTQAHALTTAAMDEAAKLGVPITVAVCDAGGHLVSLLRSDDALLASLESAQTKARTAVFFGAETRHLPGSLPVTPALLGAVSYPLAFLPGGIPIRSEGKVVGGIGIGGGLPEQDQAIAAAAVDRLSR